MLINGAVSQIRLFGNGGYENGLNVLQVSDNYPVDPSASREQLLEDADIYIGDVLCSYTGTSVTAQSWAIYTCGGDGATGDAITIRKKDDLPVSLCGIQVYGVLDEYIPVDELDDELEDYKKRCILNEECEGWFFGRHLFCNNNNKDEVEV